MIKTQQFRTGSTFFEAIVIPYNYQLTKKDGVLLTRKLCCLLFPIYLIVLTGCTEVTSEAPQTKTSSFQETMSHDFTTGEYTEIRYENGEEEFRDDIEELTVDEQSFTVKKDDHTLQWVAAYSAPDNSQAWIAQYKKIDVQEK